MRRRGLMFGTNVASGGWWENYMTVEALEDDLVVTIYAIDSSLESFGGNCEYTMDGETWMPISIDESTPKIAKGEIIAFRANGSVAAGEVLLTGIMQFNIEKQCNLLGNCMSLLYKDNAKNFDSVTTYCFKQMFQDCKIVSVSDHFLPATILADSCYTSMFNGCTLLQKAPNLPATILADSCYYGMFENCTGLQQAPDLPATTLVEYCYAGMFNASGLTIAPDLPATTLAEYCYYGMFQDCKLIIAPNLPAKTLTRGCYYYMFRNCKQLQYIVMLATDISASYCLYKWVYRVPSSGTFIKNANATWNVTGASGIPEGWMVHTATS